MNYARRVMRLRAVQTWTVFLSCGFAFASTFGLVPSAGPAQVRAQEAAEISEEQRAFFEQKIRPVLVEHCYSCHSVEAEKSKKLQGGLYLDSAAGVTAGGDSGPGLVPHKPAESLLLKALKYDGLEMPPTGKLSEQIIADFAKWIELGAPDPRRGERTGKPKREIDLNTGRQWWSFQPLSQPAPPDVADVTLDPVDRFLVAAQRAAGIKPNVLATKEKWIRRVYFDLIGLPPTPEQLTAFLSDDSPQAYEKIVDQLLNSEHYGEKWARHWLDVVRYAESGGYEFDGFRPGAFPYRDWVIKALNRDLPYDQFIRMQLAGDRLHPDDFEAASAVGFLVAGPYPGQITAKTVERIRYDQLDDMLMTIGGSMLGLTLGCVRCHEHKYDPIPHQDYYRLAATFAQASHGSRTLDSEPAQTAAAHERYRQESERLRLELNKFASEPFPQRFDAWRTSALANQPDAPRWQVLEPTDFEAERSWWKWLPGGIVAHDGAMTPGVNVVRRGKPRTVGNAERYQVTCRTFQKNINSLRLDAFSDKSLPQRGPGLNGDGSFQLAELTVTAKPLDPNVKEPPQVLKLKPVFAAAADKDQPLDLAVDGKPDTAWVVRSTAKVDNAAVFELETPLAGFAGGTELIWDLTFRDLGIGRLRLAISTDPNPATVAGDVTMQHLGEIRAMLAANNQQIPEVLRPQTVAWFSAYDSSAAQVWSAVRNQQAAEPRPKFQELYTTVGGGQDVFFLRRGEVDNKEGKAEPGFVQVLTRGENRPAADGAAAATASSVPDPRVRLAEWMTDVQSGAGPLVARVMVNRLWQHHFGRGLVATPNDFGVQGEAPSHPQLLEWLANAFVQGGWRLKPLHKRLVLSAAYRQSHTLIPENLQIDPENRLVWYFQPRRLDAELIRDALLTVGGNLDRNMYGPSVLDDSARRSIYLRVKRSELIPLMTMFDAPEPTQSIGQRTTTTVPTQALAMINSPLVRQQAERLSQRVRSDRNASLDAQIENAYRLALQRGPADGERSAMRAFIEQQRAVFGGEEPAATDKAFAEFCHVLFCLNEFVYID